MRGENQVPTITIQPEETTSSIAVHEASETAEVVMDDEYYRSNYGITLAEAQQTVRYGNEEGPLAEALRHDKCPVGSWVKQAYQEGGREAVEQKFSLFGQIATEFNVDLDSNQFYQKKN